MIAFFLFTNTNYDLKLVYNLRRLSLDISKSINKDKEYLVTKNIKTFLPNQNKKIGGKEKIVEIDKSKFGKRKYNKGKKVEGQ